MLHLKVSKNIPLLEPRYAINKKQIVVDCSNTDCWNGGWTDLKERTFNSFLLDLSEEIGRIQNLTV